MNSPQAEIKSVTPEFDPSDKGRAIALKATLVPPTGFYLDGCRGCPVDGGFCRQARAASGIETRVVRVDTDTKPYDLPEEVKCKIDAQHLALLMTQRLKTLKSHLETDLQGFPVPMPR